MKYKLRPQFTIEMKDQSVAVGPCEVELDEKQYQLEKHKLEDVEFASNEEAQSQVESGEAEVPAEAVVSEEEAKAEGEAVDLGSLKKDELVKLAEEKGLDVEGLTKAQIIEKLEAV